MVSFESRKFSTPLHRIFVLKNYLRFHVEFSNSRRIRDEFLLSTNKKENKGKVYRNKLSNYTKKYFRETIPLKEPSSPGGLLINN
jgi:hypothetical protein